VPTTDALSHERRAFHERRAVPWWWWVIALVIVVPTAEAVVVLGPEITTQGSWTLGFLCLVVTVALVAAVLLSLSRSDVDVDRRGLRAGRDTLAASAIGRVRVLDRTTARALLGRDARADAHLSIRPWVHTAVQIEVVDPTDRTPYWVVGTRRPGELAAALAMLGSLAAGDTRATEDARESGDRTKHASGNDQARTGGGVT